MAWNDFLFAGDNSITQEQKDSLTRKGLLQAGLAIMAANGRPGVTPGQAIASGLLSGLGAVGEGQKSLHENDLDATRLGLAKQQLQQGQQGIDRQAQMDAIAKKNMLPDGTFNQMGYANDLAAISPALAQDYLIGVQRQKLTEAQARQKQTREIQQGSNVLTQEMDPTSGSWNTIATAPRWQPQQGGGGRNALDERIATLKRFGATDEDIRAQLGIGGEAGAGKVGAFQLVQGADGSYYRVNKLTGEATPVNAGGETVTGANAIRQTGQNLKNIDAAAGAEGALQSFDTALGTIERLKSHPGIDEGTGISGVIARNIPGTDAYSFNSDVDAMKAQVFLPQVQSLKGMGALSDAEGKKLTDAIGALDPKMGKKSFIDHANAIEDSLRKSRARAESKTGAIYKATGTGKLSTPQSGGWSVTKDD